MADTLFTPTEVTADLHLLEKTLHQLGVDYELFFAARADGKLNIPAPFRRLAEVEAIIRHYLKNPPHRTAERFRFNTLVHRFHTSMERWSRRLRQVEERGGRVAARRRREAAEEVDPNKPQVLAQVRAVGGAATGGQVRDLFVAFRTARKARGLAVHELEYAHFAEQLSRQLDVARERGPGRDVELQVSEVGGKVRIAVRLAAAAQAPTPVEAKS
ncbi:MAG: MXAN_5187 C-terminal domain-containing protein [Candidatus Polarisedimenticolia bacterium]|nr:hypothetical protein [bacterium]